VQCSPGESVPADQGRFRKRQRSWSWSKLITEAGSGKTAVQAGCISGSDQPFELEAVSGFGEGVFTVQSHPQPVFSLHGAHYPISRCCLLFVFFGTLSLEV
jgi:hypothetical protein